MRIPTIFLIVGIVPLGCGTVANLQYPARIDAAEGSTEFCQPFGGVILDARAGKEYLVNPVSPAHGMTELSPLLLCIFGASIFLFRCLETRSLFRWQQLGLSRSLGPNSDLTHPIFLRNSATTTIHGANPDLVPGNENSERQRQAFVLAARSSRLIQLSTVASNCHG
jgi:hypothetical protein